MSDQAHRKIPCVDVIIVNWNSGNQLFDCLNSFGTIANDQAEVANVVIVDNASVDGSLDGLRNLTRTLPIKVICNSQNRGFAAACNQGAAGSIADFLLFLNPDTRLKAGCLEAAVALFAADKSGNVGIVGIQLVDDNGRVARNTARRPTSGAMLAQSFGLDRLFPGLFPPHFVGEWAHDETRIVEQVMGAFLLIRRSLYEALSGFDERFFVYFEDLDLSLRAQGSGWNSVYCSTAQAFHRGQGTTDRAVARRTFYYGRSRIVFASKYFSALPASIVSAATLFVEPITRSIFAFVSGRACDVPGILWGSVMLWKELPVILRTIRRNKAAHVDFAP